MDSLPSEVERYLASTFLQDRDRLRLACVSRRMHGVAARDRDGIVLDDILCVSGQDGFAKSPHGYWHVTNALPPLSLLPDIVPTAAADDDNNDEDESGMRMRAQAQASADALGLVAAMNPWRFVKWWAGAASAFNFNHSWQLKQRCLNSLCMHVNAWHADVLSALTVLLHCEHRSCPRFCSVVLAAVDMQLMRQAIWHARCDVVQALLEHGCVAADIKNGAPLRLTLSTIGYENDEAVMVPIVKELLRHHADPLRDRLWGIRLCFRRRYHAIAELLCKHACRLPDGHSALTSLADDLPLDQANVVLASLLDTDPT